MAPARGEQGGENGREITRRDFLDGVAITAAGLAAAASAPYLTGAEAALASTRHAPTGGPPPVFPPAQTGIAGTPDSVVRDIMRIDGRPDPEHVHSTRGGPGIHPGRVRDVDDRYDLVVVGAGPSGIAAAKWYRDRFGPSTRILLVDPLPDFGGHAHRNQLDIPDATQGGAPVRLLRTGGAVNLDSVGSWNQPANGLLDIPGSYGQPALDLLDWAGVTPDTLPDTVTTSIPSSYGLRPMLLFPREDWGADALVRAKAGSVAWADFLATTPYSAEAREGIRRIFEDTTTDWLEAVHGPLTDQEKKAILARITYLEYLKRYVGVTDEAAGYLQRTSHGLFGAGIQAVQAGDMWALGNPGFDGLNLNGDIFPGIGRTAQQDMYAGSDPTVAWPDGNSSLVRLVVSKLIPNAFADVDGARPDQETIVRAECDYGQLDRRGNAVRIRLRSTVVDVRPAHRRGRPAEVVYVGADGHGYRVRARHVVMACWNRVTARILRDVPRHQVEGLCYSRKVPLVYCRVGLRNWQAWADARIASVSPRGNSLYWDSTSLNAGGSFGTQYRAPATPAQPALVSLTRTPDDPTRLTQLESYERGREIMLGMSFADYEAAIVDVLDRSLNASGGDFDPERDVHSIIVNRWNYGYAYELCSTFDPSLFGPASAQPHVRGRRPVGNVAIANSDSGAFAYTHSAINEAFRAVQELPA